MDNNATGYYKKTLTDITDLFEKKMLTAITDLAEFSVFNYESGGKKLNEFKASEKVGNYTVKIVTTVISCGVNKC